MNGRVVFVDTSYWVGLFSQNDQHHDDAKKISAELKKMRVVTTELVLTEFLNAMSNKGASLRSAAVKIVKGLRHSAQVVDYNQTLFIPAFSDYEKFADKDWGLVDCTSFILMREKKIDTAVTFDGDFKQAGFQTIPTQ